MCILSRVRESYENPFRRCSGRNDNNDVDVGRAGDVMLIKFYHFSVPRLHIVCPSCLRVWATRAWPLRNNFHGDRQAASAAPPLFLFSLARVLAFIHLSYWGFLPRRRVISWRNCATYSVGGHGSGGEVLSKDRKWRQFYKRSGCDVLKFLRWIQSSEFNRLFWERVIKTNNYFKSALEILKSLLVLSRNIGIDFLQHIGTIPRNNQIQGQQTPYRLLT